MYLWLLWRMMQSVEINSGEQAPADIFLYAQAWRSVFTVCCCAVRSTRCLCGGCVLGTSQDKLEGDRCFRVSILDLPFWEHVHPPQSYLMR
jgi:hypothetical protein